jgi:single-stranded DNA-binding protein
MYGFNKICCSGRPIQDIKVGYSKKTGRPYTFFMFAIPSYTKIKNGNEVSYLNKPIIIQCRAFGKEAIRLGKWVSKGQFLIIEGKLLFDDYSESGKHFIYVENHYNTPKVKAYVNFKEESNNQEDNEEDEDLVNDSDLLDDEYEINENIDEKE